MLSFAGDLAAKNLVNTDGDIQVVIQKNPSDKNKKDIYLKNNQTGKQSLFITITDDHQHHYHRAEYHNGNVYVVRRMCDDMGYVRRISDNFYTKNPQWTDELWRYSPQKPGVKLYTSQGIDFRVSDDEQFIAISDRDKDLLKITILNNEGKALKSFPLNELYRGDEITYLELLSWAKNTLWLDCGATVQIKAVVKIDANTFKVNTFDLSKLGVYIDDFTLNPTTGKITFSDYPAIFDADTRNEFSARKKKTHLFVYNLQTHKKQMIAVSTAKQFHPRWIGDNTIEFDKSERREEKVCG